MKVQRDGRDFRGQTSELFAEFSCGPIPVLLRGSVIVKVGEIKEGIFKRLTNKMLNNETRIRRHGRQTGPAKI